MARTKTISDDQLLSAARVVFLKAGVGGSTKDIARQAGVSEATLFKRFGTKAELFFRAMVPEAAEAAQAVARCGDAGHGAEFLACCMQQMMAYFRMAMPYLMAMLAHPDFETHDFGGRHPDNAARQFADAITAGLAARLGLSAEQAQGGQAQGEQAQGEQAQAQNTELHATAALMVTSVHSLAQFEIMSLHQSADTDVDALIETMARQIWLGAERTLNHARS